MRGETRLDCKPQEVTMRKVVVIALALGLIAAAAVTGQSEDTAPAPGLVVDQSEIDVGAVKAGQEAVATFVLKNTGERPVKLLNVKPG
jgi:copper(I)-binding protein